MATFTLSVQIRLSLYLIGIWSKMMSTLCSATVQMRCVCPCGFLAIWQWRCVDGGVCICNRDVVLFKFYNMEMCSWTTASWARGGRTAGGWYAQLFLHALVCAGFKIGFRNNNFLLVRHFATTHCFSRDFQHVSSNNVWRLHFTWPESHITRTPREIRSFRLKLMPWYVIWIGF